MPIDRKILGSQFRFGLGLKRGRYVRTNAQKGHVAQLSDPFVICDGCGQRLVAPIDHICDSKEGS
jgi:hypothetical protein